MHSTVARWSSAFYGENNSGAKAIAICAFGLS